MLLHHPQCHQAQKGQRDGPSRRVRSTGKVAGAVALGLGAVYGLPYLVPVHDSLSFSYMVGYSNRAATLLLLAFILSLALWTRGLGLALPETSTGQHVSFDRTMYFAIAVAVIGVVLLWLFAARVVPLAEAQYFLDRYEMYRTGASLYRGFEFDYGPIMFYVPIVIAHLAHLSIGDSYFLSLGLQWALGIWILAKTVQAAARGTAHARAIFLLLCFFFLPLLIGGGPNYTPLRVCPPLGLALGLHAMYRRGASLPTAFALAAVGATLLLFFSPEQGIVFTIGTVLFFVLCARSRGGEVTLGLGLFLVLMAAAFSFAFRTGVLDNIRTVGGGVLNFPILFSFQSVVVLLLVFAAGCIVIASFRDRTSDSPLLYLICLSAVSAPAAFSRADIGHIILNMLGAILAALIVLSQYRALWRWTWTFFATVLALLAFGTVATFRGPVREQLFLAAFSSQHHSPVAEKLVVAAIRIAKGKQAAPFLDHLRANYATQPPPDEIELGPDTRLLAPLGVKRRLVPFAGLTIVTGRYPWLFPLTSTAMIQEKIAEVEAHPDWPVILPAATNVSCKEDPQQMRIGMKKLLLVPYMPPIRHTVQAADALCGYLNTHYTASRYRSPAPGYTIWLRNGSR